MLSGISSGKSADSWTRGVLIEFCASTSVRSFAPFSICQVIGLRGRSKGIVAGLIVS
jgi:hypothetical protein